MNEKLAGQILHIIIPLVVGLVSFFLIAGWAESAASHTTTINALDDKKETVMELLAASTGAAAAITLLPGDMGTPIAEKLVDLSGYFLVILCAIFLEKYLVTITGLLAFRILIPLACAICIGNAFLRNTKIYFVAGKIAVFALVIFLTVPASVMVSNWIDETYGVSINETIEAAKESTGMITESAETSEESTEDEGFLSGLLSDIQGGVSKVTTQFEAILNQFVEAIAVLLVTSCVIPILVLLLFVWVIKITFGVSVNVPGKGTLFQKFK